VSISHNAKGKALLKALAIAFRQGNGWERRSKPSSLPNRAAPKATCFACWPTARFERASSCSTAPTPMSGSRLIYAEWLQRHQGTDRITGSRSADMRSALVDYFREQGKIMIATEAGAEGINLQFCSLVVNYDLPWNPQRIEQRIGRCHRYGQKHDVVVVNFLNKQERRRPARLRAALREVPAVRRRLRRQRRGAGRHRVRRRLREAHRRHLPALPQAEEIATAFDQLQLELSLRNQRIHDAHAPAAAGELRR
jgi:superfamily II DNA/RNA helicase